MNPYTLNQIIKHLKDFNCIVLILVLEAVIDHSNHRWNHLPEHVLQKIKNNNKKLKLKLKLKIKN
jgi:hypothetical protein